MDDLRAARRELRQTINRIEGEEQVHARIDERDGKTVAQVTTYQERGMPPLTVIGLYYRTEDGTLVADQRRRLKFFPDEVATLARGITKALQEVERWRRGRR